MSTEESKSTESQETPKQGSINRLPPKVSSKKSKPVTVYLSVLFVVALLLLVMSFFMQQRSHQALEDLTTSMEESQTNLEEENSDLEKQVQALEWLRLIQEAVRTSYGEAKELAEQFEESELPAYLPAESVVEGKESPADIYKNIYAMLF